MLPLRRGTASARRWLQRLPLAVACAATAGCASKDDASNVDAGPIADTGTEAAIEGIVPGNDSGSGALADGSAAPAEAGTDAGAGDAGAPPDPCAAARFCETFESYTTGNAPSGSWKVETNLGAVSVVTDQHFGGQKSARFTTQASSGGKTAYVRLDAASVFPVPGNAYYGRMMARLESAPDQSVHWTFIQGGGVVPGQSYHALYRYGGQQPVTDGGAFVGSQLMANYDTPDSYSGTGPSSDCWNHSKGTVMPVGRWACVEWQFDGPNDTMRFWLDGAPVDALTVTGVGQGCVHQPKTFPWTAPTFASVELGWESYQADSARTLYLDDIVVATARVGCPPAM
jgi:hypothetical protein